MRNLDMLVVIQKLSFPGKKIIEQELAHDAIK